MQIEQYEFKLTFHKFFRLEIRKYIDEEIECIKDEIHEINRYGHDGLMNKEGFLSEGNIEQRIVYSLKSVSSPSEVESKRRN